MVQVRQQGCDADASPGSDYAAAVQQSEYAVLEDAQPALALALARPLRTPSTALASAAGSADGSGEPLAGRRSQLPSQIGTITAWQLLAADVQQELEAGEGASGQSSQAEDAGGQRPGSAAGARRAQRAQRQAGAWASSSEEGGEDPAALLQLDSDQGQVFDEPEASRELSADSSGGSAEEGAAGGGAWGEDWAAGDNTGGTALSGGSNAAPLLGE